VELPIEVGRGLLGRLLGDQVVDEPELEVLVDPNSEA